MKNEEHLHQVALIDWARMNEKKYPELGLLFAIPNGGIRHISVAKKLKAEGARAGVPDICLPIRREPYIGLWIEMKTRSGRLSILQKEFHNKLKSNGHRVTVCYSWPEAQIEILNYLESRFDLILV